MMPKVSPKRSLKNGPTIPAGRVWRMSLTSLRTCCQIGGISGAVTSPLRSTKIVVTPARVKLRRVSRPGTSCSLRSIRSVTCLAVSSSEAPGQAAWTTIVLMVNAGSSFRPSVRNAVTPAITATIMK
jgi:hypothetical protein